MTEVSFHTWPAFQLLRQMWCWQAALQASGALMIRF